MKMQQATLQSRVAGRPVLGARPSTRFPGLANARQTLSRRGVVIRNVAEMERTSTSGGSTKDPASVKKDIEDKVEFVVGGSRTDISPKDAYRGAAWSLRERLIEAFNHTHAHWEAEDPKFVYYLSAEFLMGRSLLNTVYNLELGEEYSAALRDLGYSLEEVQQEERDAALGNGGLGRLAACFLDSIATLDLPGWGYGIRYRYGMFKQALKDGYQIELPDIWLTEGNPWEIPRPSLRYPVNFYGKLDERTGVWVPGETVMAVAYDNPIPGYDTPTCSNLRLWDAQPVTELDLAAFNEGEYYDAVEEKRRADAIASVLYPNDATEEGKLLRLKQQFFFVTASLQDTIARYKAMHGNSIKGLEEKAFFQLNDTHPTIAVSELMRLLMDQEGLGWNEAWAITTKSLAYTNHTVMPEALEKWPVAVIDKLLPRNMFIINQIQRKWEAFLNNHYSSLDKAGREDKIQKMSIIQENPWEPGVKLVNMAYLAVVGSSTVNGVAAIHSEIIKDTIFNDFYQVWPEKFQNKTNGVTPRRWLKFCNPELSALISEALGTEDWVNNMKLLEGLKPFAEDAEFRAKWRAVKQEKKGKLAAYLENMTGDTVPTTSMFDIQIKRIHEYKRQLLNVLSIIWRYKQLKKMTPDERAKVVPRVCVVGGKAASAYDMAKRIVHLVTAVGNVINKDPETNDLLRLYFIPDYNVSLAEMIIPATELSQHISTAGTEASGTSNMKFAMNGAYIIGTMDGANIEIGENTGVENLFIFGVLADEVDQLRKDRVDFETDPRWDQIMDWIEDGEFGDMLYFKPLVDAVNNMKVGNDWFLVANDFASYLDAQEKVDELYKDQEEWTRRSILYTANSGFFSSDRTIADYAENIWGVQGCRPN